MHRLVQIVIKKDLDKQHQRRLAAQAVRLMNTIFPEVAFASWEVCERYAPQAQHCATLLHDFRLKLKEGGLLLERLGFYYYQRGCYTEADTYLTPTSCAPMCLLVNPLEGGEPQAHQVSLRA